MFSYLTIPVNTGQGPVKQSAILNRVRMARSTPFGQYYCRCD